jgi:hypothetical protein
MQKWEYKLLFGGKVSEDEMNALGQQGWELVSTITNGNGYWQGCIFKRPI